MIRQIYCKCKEHANKYEVCTISVLLDYIHARFCYGFCGEDYFLNTQGYALKNFQKKQFFSHKEWLKIRSHFNDSRYIYILDNKVETLKYFSDFLNHDWCYPREHTQEQFEQFVNKHQRVICKPVSEEGGKGIFLYNKPLGGG